MKNILPACILLFLVSCASSSGSFVLSWGDTDVRYEQFENPSPLTDAAFRYPAWRGEKVFAHAVIWSSEDIEGLDVRVSRLQGPSCSIDASCSKARCVRYVWAAAYNGNPIKCQRVPVFSGTLESFTYKSALAWIIPMSIRYRPWCP